MSSEPPRKEVYGDPIKFRLGAEFWRITSDLVPRMLAGNEYLKEKRHIDQEWVATLSELDAVIREAKFTIVGFRTLLTKEDFESVRPFDVCLQEALKRPYRTEVVDGVMDGRAELYARRRLQLEDRSLAIWLQVVDMRAVAFKNKMWDFRYFVNPEENRL